MMLFSIKGKALIESYFGTKIDPLFFAIPSLLIISAVGSYFMKKIKELKS